LALSTANDAASGIASGAAESLPCSVTASRGFCRGSWRTVSFVHRRSVESARAAR